jgi:hypothetical protein
MAEQRLGTTSRLFLGGLVLLLTIQGAAGQSRREDIYSDFVFYQKRVALEKDLRDRIITRNFSLPLDADTEDKYLSACWAVSQFLFASPEVQQGFTTLFKGYDSLSYDTKRALLEAVYAVTPRQFTESIEEVLGKETDPKLFAMGAVYLYRLAPTTENGNTLKIRMVEKFPGYDTVPILQELQNYLTYHGQYITEKTPDIPALMAHQRVVGQKIVYSFQRWDRDYPGLAIVQYADGHFARDGQGRLLVFQQLARSGPDLPYFITNGSTPQGIYSIQGTDVSHTNFIGPTPNLQLLLPFEGKWPRYFQLPDSAAAGMAAGVGAALGAGTRVSTTAGADAGFPAGIDSLRLYQELLPPAWREYKPMWEAWAAGKIGRTEIIAHGTTIDPEYFKDKPYYPLTPTMGCLCAKELWNPTSGHLLVSEQFNLVSAFLATPGRKGYLFVINVDDQHKPVSRAEVERWVQQAEKQK